VLSEKLNFHQESPRAPNRILLNKPRRPVLGSISLKLRGIALGEVITSETSIETVSCSFLCSSCHYFEFSEKKTFKGCWDINHAVSTPSLYHIICYELCQVSVYPRVPNRVLLFLADSAANQGMAYGNSFPDKSSHDNPVERSKPPPRSLSHFPKPVLIFSTTFSSVPTWCASEGEEMERFRKITQAPSFSMCAICTKCGSEAVADITTQRTTSLVWDEPLLIGVHGLRNTGEVIKKLCRIIVSTSLCRYIVHLSTISQIASPDWVFEIAAVCYHVAGIIIYVKTAEPFEYSGIYFPVWWFCRKVPGGTSGISYRPQEDFFK